MDERGQHHLKPSPSSDDGGRWHHCWTSCCRAKILTVEVIIVLYIMGRTFFLSLNEQYFYKMYGSDILRNTSFEFPNSSFCVSSDMIDNYTGNNNSYKVDESRSNHLVMYSQVANTIPSVLVTVTFGPLTDRYGRKVGIIVPIIGAVLQGVLSIVIITCNMNPFYFILLNFISGFFGNFTCILAASFSYIADVSSPRWRTLRIGIVEAGMAFGGGAGQFIGGYWLHKINCNFIPPLIFYTGCNALTLLYALLIPESLNRGERLKLCSRNPRGIKAFVQGLKLYCGSLSRSATWKLYVITLTICVCLLNVYGAMIIEVYFLKAFPFDFNSLQIGIYQSVRSASQGFANLFLMGALITLRVGDSWIVLLAIVVHCSSNMLLGFSAKAWQLYTISAVKGMEGLSWSGGRGLLSKLVKPEQQGGLFSVVASLESLASLLAGTFWPFIFPLTLKHNMRSGMIYIFMAVLGCILLPLLISLVVMKKSEGTKPTESSRARSIQKTTNNSSSTTSETDSEEEYQPLLSNSWNDDKPYYTATGVNAS